MLSVISLNLDKSKNLFSGNGLMLPNLSLTSFFTFDKYTILSSGKGLNILATFKFVLSEAMQYQQKIYCEEYEPFFVKIIHKN